MGDPSRDDQLKLKRWIERVRDPGGRRFAKRLELLAAGLPTPPAWTGRIEDGPCDLWFEIRDACLARWIEVAEHDPDVHAALVDAAWRELDRAINRASVPDRLVEWARQNWNRPPSKRRGRPPKRNRDEALRLMVRILRHCFGVAATRERAGPPRSACDGAAEAFGISYRTAESIWHGR